MTKILITGNSGYIGSHLSKILKKNSNYEIYGLDKNLPVISLDSHFCKNIIHESEYQSIVDIEFDCLIHLAAEVSVGQSVIDPLLYYSTNVFGTTNVLKKIKSKRYVIASTGAAEGMISPYGISKRAMEQIVEQHCRENNIPFTIFRFYNVVGHDGIPPTNPDGLFYSLIRAVDSKQFTLFGDDYNTKDGSCVRDYCHVNEICNAIITAINESTNTIENLGHGTGTTVKEMIEIFKKTNKCDFRVKVGPRREGDIEISVLSNPSKFMKKIYGIEDLLKI